MKKLVVMIVVLLACMLLIVGLNPSVIYTSNEGYLVPSSAKISASMSQSSNEDVALQYIAADGMIYSSLFQDYEYESKTAIDLSYPMFTNGGATLQFFSENFWLVAADFNLLETYEGLFLTDGSTYNQDGTLADGDEFLLIYLSNGLYLNAQSAVFTTAFGDIAIPANSVIQFTSTNVNFYQYKDGSMSYTTIEEMFGATITIGEHTYYYADFLEALGIFQSSISSADDASDVQDIEEAMREILQEEEETQGDASVDELGAQTEIDDDLLDQLSADTESGSGQGDTLEETEGEVYGGGETDTGELENINEYDLDDAKKQTEAYLDTSDVISSGSSGSSEKGEDEDEPIEGSVDSTGSGSSVEIPFSIPTVTVTDLDAWVYALSGTLNVEDPSAAITKGVSLAVYGAVKEDENPVGDVLSADEYTGTSAKLRRTLYSSQTFTLDGLEPGKSYYVQYTYTYTYEKTNENGDTEYTSETIESDLYKITTQTIEAGDLQTVLLTYDTEFATYSDRFSFQNFFTTNDSEYDASLDTFENFKLNTVPYLSKIILTFDDGTTVTISSSTLNKASVEGGTTYTASAGVLQSNKTYTYTMVAYDKYSNELPLSINGIDSESYIGTLYTGKAQPTVSIEEVSNITDYLTLKITVSDPNKALEDGASLKLYAVDTSGNNSSISGVWEDGTSFTGGEYLLLENAEDGATYQFTTDSLAFARTYTFSVYGDYNPQPDGVTEYTIEKQTDVLFGSAKSYTAAMTSGSLYIEVDETTINATSAAIDFSISKKSTIEVLSLVDEFRISMTSSTNSKDVTEVALVASDWETVSMGDQVIDGEDGETYFYDNGKVLLYEDGDITVELIGTEAELSSDTFWNIILASQTYDDNGEVETTADAAAEVRVTVADGTFTSATEYTLSYQAVVIKSGVEYYVPVVLEQYDFDTKKATPTVFMDDVFIANDVVQYIKLDFEDVDGAIIGTGEVKIQVYYGTTLLQETSVNVADDPQDVEFTGLTQGLEYTIKIIALSYNDQIANAGYQSNYLLETYTITAGSDITATITLNSLDYTYEETQTPIFSMSGSDIETAITGTAAGTITDNYEKWTVDSTTRSNAYWTEYFSLEEDLLIGEGLANAGVNVIVITYTPEESYSNDTTMYPYTYVRFRKSSGATTDYNLAYTYGSAMAVIIPSDAVSVQFCLSDYDNLTSFGFDIYGDTIDTSTEGGDCVVSFSSAASGAAGITTNDSYSYDIQVDTRYNSTNVDVGYTNTSYSAVYQLAVSPGDVYFVASNIVDNAYALMYNDQGELVGYERVLYQNAVFVVPENIYYVTFTVGNTVNLQLYQLSGVDEGAQYALDADIDVYDKKGTLLDTNGDSTVKFWVEKSSTINTDALGEDDAYEYVALTESELSKWIPLFVDLQTGEYTGADHYEDLLDPNCIYRLSVTAVYNESTITLATQTVQTDGALLMINNANDMGKVMAYPYANFLVTADFTISTAYDITLYGTIDFDGHTITQPTSNDYMINVVATTGTIKNLVYEVTSGVVEPIISTNYGTMENIMVKTTGVTTTDAASNAFLVGGNNGTVDGFIIELAGNVYLDHRETSLAVRWNSGALQNGYVYTTGGAAVYMRDEEIEYTAVLVAGTGTYQSIENVYIVTDIYVATDSDGNFALYAGYAINGGWQTSGADVSNCYHVGDFYDYTSKQYLSTVRVYNNTTLGAMQDVWSISVGEYALASTSDGTLFGTVSMLSDTTWQSELLGDAFMVEESVSMGYYPRLSLPTCMEKHQVYNLLPSTSQATVPTVVNDAFTTLEDEGFIGDSDDVKIYDNQAIITLRMENPSSYAITDVAIEGLTVTVLGQSMASDGLYNVFLSVAVSGSSPQYLSEYSITSIGYSNGGMAYSTSPDYTTHNIAFYKTVSSVEDWSDINNEMGWNYRLTSDLEFTETNSTIAGIMINGSETSMTSQTPFTGTIDGGQYDDYGNFTGEFYTISGINLASVDRPYVIYQLDGGSIKNLNIVDLSLSGYTTPTNVAYYAGFVRYARYYATIENVHMAEVAIKASSYMGALVGHADAAYITNCSVTDVSISLQSAKYTIAVGGLVGYFSSGYLQNCYVKELDFSLTGVSNTNGTGGLAGYVHNVMVMNCYAQGSITSDAKNIGGAVGKASTSYAWIKYVVTDVDIETISGSVGGVVGQNTSKLQGNFAIGDIFASDTNVHRVVGAADASISYLYDGYAYEGQMVNAITSDDNDDAMYLYSRADLMLTATWVDGMGFGDQWDYSVLSDGQLPLLYYQGTTTLLPGQTGDDALSLPGGESIRVSVEDAQVVYKTNSSTVDYYYVSASLTDESYESLDALVAAVEASLQTSNTGLAIEIVGMYMDTSTLVTADAENTQSNLAAFSSDSTTQDKWTYEVTADAINNCVQIKIYTTTYTNAFDTYKLQVTSGSDVKIAVIDYGESLFFAVASLAEWNDYMQLGHGYTSENFKITGIIDFDNATPTYTNLILGKLEGVGESIAFTNMAYSSVNSLNEATSGNWITSCKSITNIDFTNFTADFTLTATTQNAATFINYMAGDLQDVTISNMTITTSNSGTAAGGMGLIYELTGNASNITVKNVTLTANQNGTDTSVRSYTGSIAGYVYGTCEDIYGENITVYAPYTNCVGGFFGYMDGKASYGTTMLVDNIYLSNATITGYSSVGGALGYTNDMTPASNVYIEDVSVNAMGDAGGFAARYQIASAFDGYIAQNITVRDSSVISTQSATNTTYSYSTGGIFGLMYYNSRYAELTAENVYVSGYGRVGGIAGHADRYAAEVQVIDCTIIQHSDISSSMDNMTCAGGVFGIYYSSIASTGYNYDWVLRGTTVTADYNAGGLVGYVYDDRNITISNAYVAEDVTVTATIDNAGGIFGYATRFYLQNVASGAEVVAMGNYAGGIIGYVNYTDTYWKTLNGVYVSGSISAADYAGGLYGYVEENVILSSDRLLGAIVTADINSSGEVSPVANFANALSYTGGNIGVWDNLLVNGQTAQTIYRESSADASATTVALQAGVSFLTATGEAVADESTAADDFLQVQTFSDYQVTAIDTSCLAAADTTYDEAAKTVIESNPYMPFITSYADTSSVLQNTNAYKVLDTVAWSDTAETYVKTYDTEDPTVGIERPTPGERTGATVVYASGIDTINIETTQASITFKMTDNNGSAVSLTSEDVNVFAEDGTVAATSGTLVDNTDGTYTYTFSALDTYGSTYRVITLGFGYGSASSITIGDETYTGTDLARTVMTYTTSGTSSQNYWFYIAEGSTEAGNTLAYGTNNTSSAQTVKIGDDNLTGIVHLWQGKALASDGAVYQCGSATWERVTTTVTTTSTTVVDGVDVEVENEETVNVTATTTGNIQGTASPIFVGSNYSIYYNFSVDSLGEYLPYRAYTLGGKIYAVYTAQSTQQDGYILATQTSGSYFVLLSTETESLTSYLTPVSTDSDFVNTDIVQMSNSFGYSGSVAVLKYSDGSIKVWNYTTGAITVTYPVITTNSLSSVSGTNEINGYSVTNGSNTEQGEDTSGGTGEGTSVLSSISSFATSYSANLFSTADIITDEVDVSEVPTNDSYQTSETQAATANSAITNSDTSSDASSGISSGTGSDTSSDTSSDASNDTSANISSDASNGISGDVSDDTSSDVSDDASDDASGGVSGDASGGVSDDTSDDTSDDASGGVSGDASDDTSSDASDDTSDGVSGDTSDAVISDGNGSGSTETGVAGAYMVAYNPYTGAYEVYATEDVANGTEGVQSVNAAQALSAIATTEDAAADTSAFVANTFAFSVLSTSERNGFVMLGFVVACGIGVVVLINVKYKKNSK